jgi:hypothetical protein
MRLEQHRAEVSLGAFSIEVPLGDVLPPETPPPPPKPVAPAPPKPAQKPKPKAPAAQPRAKASTRPGAKPAGQGQPSYRALNDVQLAALQPDDRVYVAKMSREGRVVRVDRDKKVAFVNVGLFEVEAPFDGLGVARATPPPKRKGPRPAGPRRKSPEAAQDDQKKASGRE